MNRNFDSYSLDLTGDLAYMVNEIHDIGKSPFFIGESPTNGSGSSSSSTLRSLMTHPCSTPSDIAFTFLQDVVRCEEENHGDPEATAAVHQNHLKA